MKHQTIITAKLINPEENFRPKDFDSFIGQEHIKKTIKAAIQSAKKRNSNLWHILFSWESGYWKTTLAQIVANQMWVNIKIVTWYAISKPAEIISILNSLKENDILFIDEIHRLKPNIEEILYIAMEDRAIDMVMPEWWNVRIPINKFCLIGATTQLHKLSTPLKNRFVYTLHFTDYQEEEIIKIIKRYLNFYWIKTNWNIANQIAKYTTSTPRDIHNFIIMIRDFLISKWAKPNNLILDKEMLEKFLSWANIHDGWLQPIHKKYIQILQNLWWGPIGLKTIALNMWLDYKTVENDIEPLLLKLNIIEKSSRGRILKKSWFF